MNKYEIMFIVKPDVEEEARNTLIENFKSILTANGGQLIMSTNGDYVISLTKLKITQKVTML